jgi:tetratricopeptide (TPR) repeat protein
MGRVFVAVTVSALTLFVACAPVKNIKAPGLPNVDILKSSENIRTYSADYDTTFRAALDTLRQMEESSAKVVKHSAGVIIFKKPNNAGTITVNVKRIDEGTTRVDISAKDNRKYWLDSGDRGTREFFFDELEKLLDGAAVAETTGEAEDSKKVAGGLKAVQSAPDKGPIQKKVEQKLQLEKDESFLNGLSYEDLVLLDQRLETFASISREKDKLSQRCAACYIDLARFYHDDNLFSRSADALKIAISIDPDNAVAHCNLGEIYKHLKLYDAAILELQKAEQLDPELPDTYINFGIIYDDYLADDKKAVENYRKYLDLGGSNEQVSEWMAEIEAGS